MSLKLDKNHILYAYTKPCVSQVKDEMASREQRDQLYTSLLRRLIEQEVSARTKDLQERNLELEQQNKELEYQANRDVLTGLYNRRKLETQILDELKRQQRYTSFTSLVMLDIDYFKSINDRFGHIAGDTVLCQLAQLMHQHIRACDMLARWGGEEFMLLLPECNVDESRIAAEKIRNIVAAYDFEYVGKLTCSFGITQLLPSDNLLQALQRADDALYEAKRFGRNKVICA